MLFLIEGVGEEDTESEDEATINPQISLNVINGNYDSCTTKLLATVTGVTISVLVYSGSTHSFIRET